MKKKKRKQKNLMQNLGYCPFEHKAGRAGVQAGELGVGRRRQHRRAGRAAQALGARPGRAG